VRKALWKKLCILPRLSPIALAPLADITQICDTT